MSAMSRVIRAPLVSAAAVLLAMAGAAVVAPATAQNLFKWETFEKRVDAAKQIKAIGADGFGDQIDLQTGGLSFSVTDVDIPGNNALPVRFTRTYRVANSRAQGTNRMLADWDVDVPRLSGVFATEWLAGSSTSRCSSTTPPAVPSGLTGIFDLHDFWQGVRLEIPGVGGGELLVADAAATKPSNGQINRWTTTGQIYLYCQSTIANGSGEGFWAVTPDGTKYRFDRLAQRGVPGLTEKTYGGAPQTYNMALRENTLYASYVEDRFGNWVSYTYTNASTAVGRLERIESSDGRRIDITYGGNGKIYQVRAGSTAAPAQRTWTYGYGVDNSPEGRTILSSVTLPDNSAWVIQFAALSHSPIVYSSAEPGRECTVPAQPQNGFQPYPNPAPTTLSGSITHPSGATATYLLDLQEHSRSNVTVSCANFTTNPPNNPNDDNPLFAISWFDWTLTQKQISGPAVDPMTWTYTYDADLSYVYRSGSSPAFPVCTLGAACYQPTCTDVGCAGTARTTVALPDGNQERYTFGNSWQYNEGKLLKHEKLRSTGGIAESITYSYDFSRTNQAYLARYGASPRGTYDAFTSEYHRPKTATTIKRDGANFSWSVVTDSSLCGSLLCFDSFARPRKVTKSSTLGYSRSETYAYYDHLSKWVLGQLSSTAVNSITAASATYDPSTAQMWTFSAFGKQQQALTYYGDGTVATVTDGNNQTTWLGSWYRGVPQSISYADGHSESAVANAFGDITSVTDELGFLTSYTYDAMGRLTGVTYPTGDSVAWQSTTVAYAKVGTAEYGIPANHWRRIETTGARVTQTFYDGLWRPILERRTATDGSVGDRFVRKAFDYRGLETFVSYPTSAVTHYANLTSGLSTAYDVLARVTGTSASSELGTITTSTTYGSPFLTTFTNGRGFSTTTSYQAFDVPTYDTPIQVQAPEGVTTTFTRDVFGKPLSLSRNGVYYPPSGGSESLNQTRRFVYDSYQRLCKTLEPDAGTTVFDYDAADNLLWKSAGNNSLTSLSACQRESVALADRSIHHYDLRNRLLFVDHPADSDDVGYTYMADGAMQTATSGTLNASVPPTWNAKISEWTYSYNKRRLLTGESLAVGGQVFTIGRSYNALGDENQLTYPSGLVVSTLPNAFGEPRQAGTFASGATYHPNGHVAGFTYGNSAVRSVTLNGRQLPNRIQDLRFGLTLFDHQLGYDANANLASIVDGQPGAWETRTLYYDGRDRLSSVIGPVQGNETYTYDVLDNVRRYVRGSVDQRYMYTPTSGLLDRITDPNGITKVSYAWNTRGEVASRSRPGSSVPPPPPPGRVFFNSFEPTTPPTDTQNIVFDRAGRLRSFFNGASTYSYDAHGLRVANLVNSIGQRFHVYARDGKLLYTHDGAQAQRTDFIYLGDTLVAERERPISTETATVTYLHSDFRGTPSVKTNSGGSLASRNLLKAYGESYDGLVDEGPGFTKHATDTLLSMVYMQQRYYDPEAMRFTSTDPVSADAQSFNRYWYANNNPYTYVDRDGRIADTIADIGFIAYSTYTLATEPSWTNGLALGADVVGAIIPFATGLGTAVRTGLHSDELVDAAKLTSDTSDEARDALVIYRRGDDAESATRLERKSTEAENSSIGIHGVSGSTTKPDGPCSSATCGQLEAAGFKVHDTPTRADPNHKTIEMPKPVRPEDAKRFNQTMGRDQR